MSRIKVSWPGEYRYTGIEPIIGAVSAWLSSAAAGTLVAPSAATMAGIGTGVAAAGTGASLLMNKKMNLKLPPRDTAAADAAARAEADKLRKRRGFMSMIATSPTGVEGSPNTLKTILG